MYFAKLVTTTWNSWILKSDEVEQMVSVVLLKRNRSSVLLVALSRSVTAWYPSSWENTPFRKKKILWWMCKRLSPSLLGKENFSLSNTRWVRALFFMPWKQHGVRPHIWNLNVYDESFACVSFLATLRKRTIKRKAHLVITELQCGYECVFWCFWQP